MAEPTLVQFSNSNWADATATGTNETTASFTWQTGDIVHIFGVTEDNAITFALPTTAGSNLTFSQITLLSGASNTRVYYWRGTATGAGSGTISAQRNDGGGANQYQGIAAFQYRDSDGTGTPVTATGGTAKTLSVVVGGTNSHVWYVGADWNATTDATVDPTPSTNATERLHVITTGATFFLNSYGDQGSPATTSYGITNHTGTVDMCSLAIEILGTESASLEIAADAGAYTVTGSAASPQIARQVVAAAGSYALTGSDATLTRNLPIVADAGSYAITGSDATFNRTHQIVADAGSYALTGATAALLHDWIVTAEAGAYTLTGSDATLTRDLPLVAGAGAYDLTGSDAALLHAWVLTAEAGSYTLTGSDASLDLTTADLTLTAEEGSYTLTGSAAGTLHGWVVSAEAGAYDLTGQDATLQIGKTIAADAGAYEITGEAASLEQLRQVIAESGIYLLTGSDASLDHSAVEPEPEPAPGGGGTFVGQAFPRRAEYLNAFERIERQQKARARAEAADQELEDLQRKIAALVKPKGTLPDKKGAALAALVTQANDARARAEAARELEQQLLMQNDEAIVVMMLLM